MDWTTVIGNIALVCTIASYFTALPLCLDFFRKGTTGNYSVLPFLAGATCTSLWLMYSIALENGMLQVVNSSAVSLQITYVCSFYINTQYKESTFVKAATVVAFVSVVYAIAFHLLEVEAGVSLLGYLASGSSIIACASPLVTIKEVIKAQSSETLPFPMIFSTFVVTSLWFIYGVLVEDKFIQVPNLIGSFLTLSQLSLIAIYPAKKDSPEHLKEN